MVEMAKRSEVKAFEDFVEGNRRAVWYSEYLEVVEQLENEDPSLKDDSEIKKEQLKKKLEGYIAYR